MTYQIQELLDNSVQQFDDMEPDELAAFGASFRETIEDSPVVLALVDGRPVLVEGRQRLLLLLQGQRATLNDNEAVLMPDVATLEQAEDAALTRNLNRRKVSQAQTGDIALRLMARGLSQAEAGRILGIAQGTVSKAVTASRSGPVTVTPQPREDEWQDGEPQSITGDDLRPAPPRSGLLELSDRTQGVAMLLRFLIAGYPVADPGFTVNDHGVPGDDAEAISAWTVQITDETAAREAMLGISALAARLADLEDLIKRAPQPAEAMA